MLDRIDREGKTALVIGGGLALVSILVPFIGYLFGYLGVLVHEMGHALGGWLHGYPSIPAFDFTYGGGWTTWQDRSPFIRALVWGALAYGLWRVRSNRQTLTAVAILVGLFLILDLTRWHQALNLYLGHGLELVIAALFVYRALSGVAVINPLERPLYAGLGFFIVFINARLAFGLVTSWYAREEYAQAKGGGHIMDFSRLANDHLRISLESVALLHLIVTLAVLPLTFLVFAQRERLVRYAQERRG